MLPPVFDILPSSGYTTGAFRVFGALDSTPLPILREKSFRKAEGYSRVVKGRMQRGLFVRKRIIVIYAIALLCVVSIFTYLHPLQFTSNYELAFVNPPPQVIPGLREWYGGSGSFVLNASSHIVVDPVYTSQLMDATQVFQEIGR